MMMEDDLTQARINARVDWDKARGRARRGVLSVLAGAHHEVLLSFEDVRTKLRLFQKYYKGIENIPLDKIVGSVDRYKDFTREFLPLVDEDAERWQRVAALQRGRGLPPIEVYKVGDVYFVKDGNHRVSVLRQLGATKIEAHVWEYPTPVKLGSDDEIDDILVKAERQEFLERTRLDHTRPGHGIAFTAPGRYPELLYQIEVYRRNLSLIDGYDVSFEDAAANWYDMVYSLAAETLVESDYLDRFPGRTVADLYTWVYKHREEIAQREGRRVSTEEAAADLMERDRTESQPGFLRALQSIATAGAKLVQDALVNGGAKDGQAVEEIGVPVEVLGRQLRQIEPALAYPDTGRDGWREWRAQLRDKLAELLGVEMRIDADRRKDPPEVTVHERVALSGVRREAITLVADDGLQIPGYVFVPLHLRERGQAPGLLIYPGHGTIKQTAGLERSVHNSSALSLARAGFVTITLEERGFGYLGGQADYRRLNALANLVGQSWAGMVVADGMRAFDYLQSRPEVDLDRLGVAGMGMAGGLAMFTAALDERVLAVVIGDYLMRLDYITPRGPRYSSMCVAGLRRYAETADIGALIAPRPALYLRSETGAGQDKDVFLQIARPYELLEVPDRLKYQETGPGRLFDIDAAAVWFYRWLIEEDDAHLPLLRYPYRLD